jgi:hypothetical protein
MLNKVPKRHPYVNMSNNDTPSLGEPILTESTIPRASHLLQICLQQILFASQPLLKGYETCTVCEIIS